MNPGAPVIKTRHYDQLRLRSVIDDGLWELARGNMPEPVFDGWKSERHTQCPCNGSIDGTGELETQPHGASLVPSLRIQRLLLRFGPENKPRQLWPLNSVARTCSQGMLLNGLT